MAPALSDLERLTIRVALEELNTAFCYHLDHNEVDALLELFVDDVYYTHWQGGGGYGDPLLRDPAAVLDDVLDGFISARSAREHYGVAIDNTCVDQAATEALRAELRAQRASAS